jgi:hypothetical protein
MIPISFIIAELLMYTLLAICLFDAWKRGLGWVAFIVAGSAFGVLLEYADILTNKGYTYGNFMLMVGPVPICIGIGWGVIMYSVRLFTDSLGLPIWTRPFLDALLAVNIDLSMDVVAYRLGMWQWDWSGTGRSPFNSDWFGIPWANFYGWMMVVLTFSSLVRWLERAGQRRGWGNWWRIAAPLATLILAEPILLLGITWPSWAAAALNGILKPSNTWWLITWTLGLVCIIVAAHGLRHRQPSAHPPLPTWIVPLVAHTYFPLWLFLGGFWLQDGWLVVAAAANALLCLAIHLGGMRLSRHAISASPTIGQPLAMRVPPRSLRSRR